MVKNIRQVQRYEKILDFGFWIFELIHFLTQKSKIISYLCGVNAKI